MLIQNVLLILILLQQDFRLTKQCRKLSLRSNVFLPVINIGHLADVTQNVFLANITNSYEDSFHIIVEALERFTLMAKGQRQIQVENFLE